MKSNKRAASQREVRTITPSQPISVRLAADGSKHIGGYAIVFNSASSDLGGFKEIVSPNALDRTLRENPDVLALRDHKQELLLGRTTAGTLELSVDATGLAFNITLPKTPIGDDTAENVRLRNLSGCSFGFTTRDDLWTVDRDGNVVRTLLDVDLYEISVTSFPSYSATIATTPRSCPADIRSRIGRSSNEQQDEEQRCECGCSACLGGDCEDCTDEDCTDDDCQDCPIQADEERSDSLRIRALFAHRMIT